MSPGWKLGWPCSRTASPAGAAVTSRSWPPWCNRDTAAWNIFVVQRQDAQVMAPAAQIDPAYAEELAQAADAGVKIVVLTTEIEPPQITLAGTLPVRL